jgi:phosphoglycolate phosphatase
LIEAVLFDLDGTLAHTSPGIAWALGVAVERVLPGRELPDLEPLLGPPLAALLGRILPGVAPEAMARITAEFRQAYDSEGWRRSEAYPGVKPTLRALVARGVRCYVTTNKPRLPTGMIVEQLGLREWLAAVLSPDSLTPPAGSKAALVAHLLRAEELVASRVLLVGDAAEDAEAAAALGLGFVAVTYGYGQPHLCLDPQPVAVLEAFAGLLEVVRADG